MERSPTAVREAAQAARLHSQMVRARAEWTRRKLVRQRRRCAETVAASIVALSEVGAGPLWDFLDAGDLAEIEDVGPMLRLVEDPDD